MVDGYNGQEYDDFHWDLFFGSVLHGGIASLLVWIGTKIDGPAVGWLGLAAAILIDVVVLAAWVSSLWRRYQYLSWWKKVILWLPSLTTFAFWILLIGVVAGAIEFVAQLFGGSAGLGWSSPPGGGQRGVSSAVDSDGNVYQWSSWQGKWVAKPGSLGFGQAKSPVRQGPFGPVEKTGAFGSAQFSDGGGKLYEPRGR